MADYHYRVGVVRINNTPSVRGWLGFPGVDDPAAGPFRGIGEAIDWIRDHGGGRVRYGEGKFFPAPAREARRG